MAYKWLNTNRKENHKGQQTNNTVKHDDSLQETQNKKRNILIQQISLMLT